MINQQETDPASPRAPTIDQSDEEPSEQLAQISTLMTSCGEHRLELTWVEFWILMSEQDRLESKLALLIP